MANIFGVTVTIDWFSFSHLSPSSVTATNETQPKTEKTVQNAPQPIRKRYENVNYTTTGRKQNRVNFDRTLCVGRY